MASVVFVRSRTNFVAGVLPALMALTGLMLTGCKVGPDYKRPSVTVPPHFSEEAFATRPSTRSTTQPTTWNTTQPVPADIMPPDYQRWWESFNDRELTSLVERAAAGNLDIAVAVAQIEQARAQRGVAAAGFFPYATANGQYTHSRTSQISNTTPAGGVNNFWQAGLDASWEIDLFGGVARSVEAAQATVAAQQFNRRAVTLATVAEVAAVYMDLRGSQRRLAIAEDQLKAQYETLDLTRSKAKGGLIPDLDVAQQEATVATTAAAVPSYETEIRQDIHALSILLGEDPGALSAELSESRPIPVGPPVVPPGLPSELLQRRPDIGLAESLLVAANANIGVATAQLFPKVSLTGDLGVQAPHLDQLFEYSRRFYSVGPSVTWDVFDAGQVWYEIHVQDATTKQAVASYRKTVLSAFKDVDDALVAYNREQARLQALKDSVQANQRAYDLSLELFQKGSKDFLSVLVAEQELFTARDAEIASEEAVQADLVVLYKALGGGWEITEPPPEKK